MIYDVVIVGGGPAGYTAAKYAADAGLAVLVLEKLSAGGQMASTDKIDNYPGFPHGIDGFTLGEEMQKAAELAGAETVLAQVDALHLKENPKRIESSEGVYFAKTVILATGANPRLLDLPMEQALTGKGVHYCAHCDGHFYKDKTVAVVGGGKSAVADALILSRLAKKVYLIHRRDSLRAAQVYVKALEKAENVEFLWNSTVDALLYQQRLTGISLTDHENGVQSQLPLDGLFVSIGRTPATQLAQELELDESGYILADETTKTSVPGVFAAGDVRAKVLRQIVTATADGAVAAHMAQAYLTSLS